MSVIHNPGRYNAVSLSAQTRHNYAVNSYFPSRKPRPSSLKGHGQQNVRRDIDINENMQHATLINIVAAVNEDLGSRQAELRKSSASTYHTSHSNRSNVTIISNIVFPHDKTVSIPQTKQREFSVPEKIVQRKPVYYKHSKDLEVDHQPHQIRLFEVGDSYNFKVKLTKQMENEKELLNCETKRTVKTKDKQIKDEKKTKTADDKNNKTPRDCESRLSSGVRRLGTLKKSEPRQLHEIHKCDAIDLLDKSIDTDDPAMSALDDSRKMIPTNQLNRVPYMRTKSLPVMFPTKSANKPAMSVSSAGQKQPLVLTDRPLSRSLRQRTPDSMYKRVSNLPGGFGYGEMSINNGINEAPDIAAPLVHDSSKFRNISAVLCDRLRRSKNARSPSSTLGRQSHAVFIMPAGGGEDIIHNRRVAAHSNLYKSKRALHEAVRRVLTGRSLVCETSISRKIPIGERKETPRYNNRSYQQARPTASEMNNNKPDRVVMKRVQFQSSDSSAGSSDITSTKHENTSPEIHGGSNILKRETSSVRSYSPGIQPMSTRELLRLEHKILPVNGESPIQASNAMYFSTSSGIHLQRSGSDLSIQLNSNYNSSTLGYNKDETVESIEGGDSLGSTNNDNGDVGDMRYIDEDYGDDDDDDDDGDFNEMGNKNSSDFYKLVKAVDNNPYTGYEHKKLRRTVSTSKSKESDSTKAQYIKVKLS